MFNPLRTGLCFEVEECPVTQPNCKIETLYGGLWTPDWPDDLILRSLKQLGEWAALEPILASSLLDVGEVLWDAGAFIGTFPLGLARETLPGHVVTIEANSVLEPYLTENMKLLPCASTVLSCGIGRNAGLLVNDREQQDNHGANSYTFRSVTSGNAEEAIICRTLAQMRNDHGDYDMIKMDLEGMELDAVLGDIGYLRSRKPTIWAECNEDIESLQFFGALKWLGYDVLYVAFPAFRSANFNGTADLIYPMAYEAALVAGTQDRLNRVEARAASKVSGEDIICHRLKTSFDLRKALFDTPRWAHKDWVDLSRPELVARLGRSMKDTKIENFLTDNVPNTD